MSESGTAKLLTEGKKCTGDIEISYTKSSCDTSVVRGFVALEKDSNGNIVKLNHDFSMNSARLVGGSDNKVKLEVIYTNFQ